MTSRFSDNIFQTMLRHVTAVWAQPKQSWHWVPDDELGLGGYVFISIKGMGLLGNSPVAGGFFSQRSGDTIFFLSDSAKWGQNHEHGGSQVAVVAEWKHIGPHSGCPMHAIGWPPRGWLGPELLQRYDAVAGISAYGSTALNVSCVPISCDSAMSQL